MQSTNDSQPPIAPSSSAPSSQASGWKTRVNSLIQRLPYPLKTWIRQYRARRFVETHNIADLEILPVETLKAKQKEALQYLINAIGAENVGDYLEFGVFAGTSLSCMYQSLVELGLDQVRLFGFDSFEGLPESAAYEDDGTWEPGGFKLDMELTQAILAKRGVDRNRVILTKGWFCDTLTPAFRDRHHIKRAGVIMVDCDLYSSTVDVLRFCEPLIQETAVIFFDDWHSNSLAAKNMGEKKAFDEFLQAHPDFSVQEFGTYADCSTCLIVHRQPRS